MNNTPERRAFNRFPVEFAIELVGEDSEGKSKRRVTDIRSYPGHERVGVCLLILPIR